MENEKILASLIRIEMSAKEIDDETETKKEAYARELDERIKKYDEKLNKEKEVHIAELKERLKNEQKEELLIMRQNTLAQIAKVDEAFEKNHTKWAKEIFEQIVKE